MSETLVKIFVRDVASQSATVQMVDFRDGTRCGVRVRYAAYTQRWYLWLLALDGAVITGPIKLVPGIDLLLGSKHDSRVPQGQLFIYDPDRNPPTKDTIDVSSILYYRRP